jgi:hypothetical protein
MKLLPIALTLCCAAFLIGCGRPAASDSDQETQEQLIEQKEALQLSQLHEREAALDERERLIAQREQQLPPLSVAPPEQAAEPEPPEQPAPPPASTPSSAPEAASPDASYGTFYDALSAYGTWVQMPGYGFIWQPAATVQNPLWRPYTIGHWAFTDAGWTWVSDEPFGWITYHYGRWMRTRTLGWVWTPGEQWAPAWVSWRYGGDYAGWAPLPPEAQFDEGTGIQQWADQSYNLGPADYTWVPAAEFGDDNMADEEAPPDQAEAIYDDSNNITNIYYDTAASFIVCYGPNYDFIRSRSHRPFHAPFTLMRGGFHPGGKNSATISGNTLRVPAPRIRHDPTPTAPRSVRGLVADTRLINPPGASSAPGTTRQPPVAYQFPRLPQAPPAGIRNPSQPNPASFPRSGANAEPVQPVAPAAVRPPPRMNPTPVPPDLDAQRAHELAVIQQEQAGHERQAAEAARQSADQQSAAEAARAQRAAADEAAQTAHAAREQAAAVRQSQAAQASHAASLPAGTQAPGRGQ